MEYFILNGIVLHFEFWSGSFSLLKVSLQELIVDHKLVHSLLEGHAVVFELISSLSFVGQVLTCGLKSIDFTVLLNYERIFIILVLKVSLWWDRSLDPFWRNNSWWRILYSWPSLRHVHEASNEFCALTHWDYAITIRIKLLEEVVELCPGGLLSSLAQKDIVKKLKNFSFFKESASVSIVFSEHFLNHVVYRILRLRSGLTLIHEVVYESIALTFWDYPITIVIVLRKEVVELIPCCFWSSLTQENFIKKLKDLILL